MNITDISGIGDATAQNMKAQGLDSVEAVAQATVEQLVAVPGIGTARAAALKGSARRLLAEADAGTGAPSPEDAVPSGDSATNGQEDGNGKKKDGKKKDGKKKKEKRKKGKKDKRKGRKDKKRDKGGKKKKNRRK